MPYLKRVIAKHKMLMYWYNGTRDKEEMQEEFCASVCCLQKGFRL
jgi:hypothetical protein